MSGPRLLCVDGGSTTLVVGVVQDGRVLAQESGPSHVAHGVSVLDVVARMVPDASAVDGIAVARGPGSFTGLRTMLATVKGLALGWDMKVFGVSSLHALARSVPVKGPRRVVACLDARKGQVYASAWSLGDDVRGDVEDVAACVVPPAEWKTRAAGVDARAWAGDGRARYAEILGTSADDWTPPYASLTALYECAAWRLDAPDDVVTLEPLYVRSSYADLQLGQAPAGQGSAR